LRWLPDAAYRLCQAGRIEERDVSGKSQETGEAEGIPPLTVIPSTNPYGYRARIQLKVKKNGIGLLSGEDSQDR
jgi:hypothetical protein